METGLYTSPGGVTRTSRLEWFLYINDKKCLHSDVWKKGETYFFVVKWGFFCFKKQLESLSVGLPKRVHLSFPVEKGTKIHHFPAVATIPGG